MNGHNSSVISYGLAPELVIQIRLVSYLNIRNQVLCRKKTTPCPLGYSTILVTPEMKCAVQDAYKTSEKYLAVPSSVCVQDAYN